jgi:hypothetical protein
MCLALAHADAVPVTRQSIGDVAASKGWQGLKRGGVLPVPGEAVFNFANAAVNEPSSEWRDFYGLQIEAKLEGNHPVALTALARIPGSPDRAESVQETKASVTVSGTGWHTVTLPWGSFDFDQSQPAFAKSVQELRLSARFVDGQAAGKLTLRTVRLVKGEVIAIAAAIRGKSAKPGDEVDYVVSIGNCTDMPQTVSLAMETQAWEAMTAAVTPAVLQLAPDETKDCTVRVKVAASVPPGGRAEQWLRAIPVGDPACATRLSFVTSSFLPHPYLVHTAAEWQEVRDKVPDHAWARQAQETFVQQERNWTVPEAPQPLVNPAGVVAMEPYPFENRQQSNLLAAAYSWQLMRDTNAASHAALFLKRFADPMHGYPPTLRSVNGDFGSEGVFMQTGAMAYDMILDAGVLTDADREQIEKAFRLYVQAVIDRADAGQISQQAVSEICGALYAGLAIQDWNLAGRCLHGPGGLMDEISTGVMDDGWWYETSITRQTSVAAELSQAALALRPWGVNLVDAWLPPRYAPAKPSASSNTFGPVTHNYITLKRVWDALSLFADYRGMIFGLNDSPETSLAADATESGVLPFEIACYLYPDPAYAAIVKQAPRRDLIYGLAELPELAPDRTDASACADNAGLAMLRSHATEPRARIEAVLRYGTHGGENGRFDHTGLLALQRYGKSLFRPEISGFSGDSLIRRIYVPSSMAANMVAVDDQDQEPVESPRLLFFAGALMQAAAVEANARWFNPLGGQTDPDSDRVRQRRLLILMPDYVVLADNLKAPQSHTYDNVFHLKGFTGLYSGDKQFLRHDDQMSTNAQSAAQFIRNCDWYSAAPPSRATFNDPDSFKLDVISLWPPDPEILVASAPGYEPASNPAGGELRQPKIYAIRSAGSEGRFLTLLEPHEKDSLIRKAEAFGSSRLKVELTDGRIQEIEISNLEDDGANIIVRAQESRNGRMIRSETTTKTNQ